MSVVDAFIEGDGQDLTPQVKLRDQRHLFCGELEEAPIFLQVNAPSGLPHPEYNCSLYSERSIALPNHHGNRLCELGQQFH